MHEEIRSLRDTYDVQIVTYREPSEPRKEAFPYHFVPYLDTCLQYGDHLKVDGTFSSDAQREFISRVDDIITDFGPQVLHGHYLGLALLLDYLGKRHDIPWTIRTHSMDVLSEPEPKLQRLCAAANSELCGGVLAFRANRLRLELTGLESSKIVDVWPTLAFKRFYRPKRRPQSHRIMCAGPAIPKKAHSDFIDLAHSMRRSGLEFVLYAAGPKLQKMHSYNSELGDPARITYVDPELMPEIYPRYDWLVYPSDCAINKVGLPLAIAEAMAAGVGVCWQELPDRRNEQLEFLGGAGHLFSAASELPALIDQPYDETRRLAGLEAARRCDIDVHKHLLTDIWDSMSR
jgi:glycosyltransferase involved in cell wall biosynthesis